ncbi:MAG: NAD(P)-binding protein, partial [Acidobacteria bacterium]|nr:NAD(P)-binding protein [Acidobacteriota bacterium]
MANRKVNAVVVGSGAGGGVMAKELAEAGLSVVLLERGRAYTTHHFSHDELHCQCENGRDLAYGPPAEPNPRTFRYDDSTPARLV